MKKGRFLLVLSCLTAIIGLVSCQPQTPTNPTKTPTVETPPVETTKYVVTFNTNGGSTLDSIEVIEGEKISKPTDPKKDGHTFAGWYKDDGLTTAWNFDTDVVTSAITLYAKWEVSVFEVMFDSQGGSSVAGFMVNKDGLISKPEDPVLEGFAFIGWYKEESCTNLWDFENDKVTQNVTLYAKWQELEYEELRFVFAADEFDAGVFEENFEYSRFVISATTEIRNRTRVWTNPDDSSDTKEFSKSIKIGANSNSINVSVPGTGKLYLYVQNGSSSAQTQKINITDPQGNKVEHEFDGINNSSPVVKLEIDVTEGDWLISRYSGTVDIYLMELVCTAVVAEESGFEIVRTGTINYLCGQELDLSGLTLQAVYGNGKLVPLAIEDVNVSHNFDGNTPGVYTITIKYKEYEVLTYDVNVLEVEELILGYDAVEKLPTNTSYGNGIYFNHSVKEVYAIGEEFDPTGLSVKVRATSDGDVLELPVKTGITFEGFDSNKAGKQEVTVVYTYSNNLKATTTLTIYVVDTEPAVNEKGEYQAKVDMTYTGVIGEVVDGYNMFTTIQQALDYYSRTNIDVLTRKNIILAEGTFNEKIEITIPYLTIKGAGANKTIIEWDSLYGLADEGGFIHTTDSTQTVAVREEATNVIIEDLTISNYFNSLDHFDERMGKNYGEHRALALLVQSDKFIMKNSRLLGYQDTVEFFTGRQYMENVYIQGLTDFIFGTNNTTYFTNCEIHSISVGKTDGGYLTAFKGCNKGDGDYITYGAIFDGCKFTAPDDVMANGNTAIGRPWGSYAAVMVMNSELGAHISTKGSTGASKNERYVSMNAKPTDLTVQFTEYNNTGAGAITEEVAGMKLLTASEAANYNNFEVIFGTSNGAVKYLSAWNPLSSEVEVDKNTYYYFNGNSSVTGTSHTYDQKLNGTTGTFGDIVIDATKGKVEARTSDTQINAGATLTFNVAAGSSVVVATYPGYHNYTLNGVATVADTFEQYYKEDTTVVFEATATTYLFSIIIKPNQEAPDDATITKLEISGQTTSFTMDEEFVYDGLVVKAIYSDFSVVTLTEGYTVTLDREVTEAGEYQATVVYGEYSVTYTVEFVGDGVDPTYISKTSEITFGTSGNWETSKLIVESGAKVRNNGGDNSQISGNISIKVLAFAEITVSSYSGYTSYSVNVNGSDISGTQTGTTYSFKVTEDSLVEFVCGSNNYFYSITVTYPYVFKENTTVDLSATNGLKVEGSVGEYEGLTIDATNGKFSDNGGGWVQVNTGTVVTLNVLENAVISLVAYSSADSFTIEVADGVATITCVANDYLKSITVTYPYVFKENTTLDLSATGANIQGGVGTYEGLEVDATTGKFADNGSGWVQVNTGTIIKLNVLEGAQISVVAYSSADSFTIEVIDGVATITCVANDYLKSITVTYPYVFKENTTLDLSATGANIQGGVGTYEGLEVDATTGKFADNNGGWVQVNTGTIIKLNVLEGAQISVVAYSSADSFTIEVIDGVATITCVANDYLKSITVTY